MKEMFSSVLLMLGLIFIDLFIYLLKEILTIALAALLFYPSEAASAGQTSRQTLAVVR